MPANDATDHDLTDPAFYDWFTTERVRFSDTDMVGHVNNVGHTALIETGRIAYAMELSGRVEVPFGRIMFVRLEVDFREDLYWPSHVDIGARIVGVGTSSFRIATGVFHEGACKTTAINVMVHLGDDRRAARIPDDMRAVLTGELPTSKA